MTVTNRSFAAARQRGSTLTGIIIGLIIGLGIAVVVALVITKGASPFTDRSNRLGRPADLEPSQAADPNKPLYGNREPAIAANRELAEKASGRSDAESDPLGQAIAGMQEVAADGPVVVPTAAPVAAQPAAAAAPAAATTGAAPGDGYIYYLQAGAFREMTDAENTRAKLALLGFEAAISDRGGDGGVLHRVRVGPYHHVEAMNKARAKLLDSGVDVAIVRNQR